MKRLSSLQAWVIGQAMWTLDVEPDPDVQAVIDHLDPTPTDAEDLTGGVWRIRPPENDATRWAMISAFNAMSNLADEQLEKRFGRGERRNPEGRAHLRVERAAAQSLAMWAARVGQNTST